MRLDIITIFPEYFGALDISLLGKARRAGILDVHVHDLREWTHDRHRTVDDTPYGGGPGMVMKPEPWGEALDALVPPLSGRVDENSPRPASGASPASLLSSTTSGATASDAGCSRPETLNPASLPTAPGNGAPGTAPADATSGGGPGNAAAGGASGNTPSGGEAPGNAATTEAPDGEAVGWGDGNASPGATAPGATAPGGPAPGGVPSGGAAPGGAAPGGVSAGGVSAGGVSPGGAASAGAVSGETAGGRGVGEFGPPRLIIPTPSGRPFTQADAVRYAAEPWLVFACGRYEGIDSRVAEEARTRMPVDEVSLGDFVLAGGEVAVLVMVEAIGRLLPGVLGNADSVADDSFAPGAMESLLEGPVYTKPPVWRERPVPDILLSGHHGAIARWRRDEALRRTARTRPELLSRLDPEALDKHDRAVLREAGFPVDGEDMAD